MDDQLLEKRLDSLKKAYNDMPEEENRSAILAAIKKDQKKQKKNTWFHLPYAASFIGVGMIAGVLMMQYIGEHVTSDEKTELNQAVSDEKNAGVLKRSDVKAEFDALQKYYVEKELKTKEKLGFLSGFENSLHRDIPMELNEAETAFLSNLEDQEQIDLEEVRKRYTSEIDQAFTLPSEIIDRLLREKNDQISLSGPEYNLLNQLDSFMGAYYLSMTFYEDHLNKAVEQEGAETVIKKMNAGGKGLSSPRLKEMSAGAVENGYAFKDEDGRIVPYVNFMGIADRLRGEVNKDYVKYLELRSNRVHNDQGEVISYKNLADVLVKLEKTIATVKNSTIEETMRNDAQSLYALFVASPILFDKRDVLKDEVKTAYLYLIESYPDTDTANAVKLMFEQMQREKFQRPADEMEMQNNLIYPGYLNIRTDIKEEDIINRRVLPISDFMLSSYKKFAANKNFDILKHYGPFEIMQLYFHADQIGDYETKYALYSKKSVLLPEDQYIKEMQEAEMDISETLKGYEFASLYRSSDQPENVIGVQLHFKDRSDAPVFQMVQEDGFWKVQYLPFQ
ncbi:hypothetical protein [Mesobacillus jeotgali]|uniref:hypothetical protein n=1 Tax=Mesobacillus jeotgali TaxID=129985 RepID=UPI0009A715E6|nr:hypothetical protein [Mesobacillus jeotgali]